MNLLIRLFIAILFSFFKPKVGLQDTARYEGRTWPWDYDIQGHMTNTRFMALADLAIFQFLLRSGVYRYFASNRLLPVVITREVRFKRILTFPRRYTIHTRMAYWDDEYYCWKQVFESDGKYAAEVYTLGVLLKQGTRDKFSPGQVAFDMTQERLEPKEPDETILHLLRKAKKRPELEEALEGFDA